MTPERTRLLFLDCAPFMGGAQESLWTLLAECHRRKIAVGLICANNDLAQRAVNYNIPAELIHATHWRKSIPGLMAFLRERRNAKKTINDAVAEFQPDAIVLNTVRAAMLFPSLSPNCIIHDRDLRVPWLLPGWLARRCPNIIAVSQTVAKKWSNVGAQNLAVIHNMLDIDGLQNEADALPQRHKDNGENMVALVADFVPWKNAQDFVAAMALLHKELPKLNAVVKGRVRGLEGEDCINRLREAANKANLQSVLKFDAQNESALPAMAQADIVVSTATNEPFGRTAVEALALGKPFVAYDSGGFPEILKDCPTATLVKPRDPKALADAIRQWLPEDKRRHAAEKARQFARSFDSSSLMPMFLEYFSNITEKQHNEELGVPSP